MTELKYTNTALAWKSPSTTGGLKYWNGSAWTKKVLKYWDGLNWQLAMTYDRWATKTSMGWTQPVGALAYGTNIYVPTPTHMQSYNVLTDTWATLTAPPVSLDPQGACAIVADKVYVVHGSRLDIYNSTANTWSTGTAYPGAGYRSPWIGAINGKIYVGGGNDGIGNALSDHWEYDPAGNTWLQKASAGQGRWLAASGVINNKLYVAGGRKANTTTGAMGAVQVYDPAADRWDGGAAMFESVEDAQFAVIGSKLYVCGGYNPSFVRQDTCTAYDASVDLWNFRAKLPTPLVTGAAAAVNGRIYVCGGFAGSETTTVYEYGA